MTLDLVTMRACVTHSLTVCLEMCVYLLIYLLVSYELNSRPTTLRRTLQIIAVSLQMDHAHSRKRI